MSDLHPCLWFDNQAEAAARFYTSLFKNSKMGKVSHYGDWSTQVTELKPGSVLTASFEILGLPVTALNGGPIFKHTPAFSFFVWCETDEEIEGLWKKLILGGNIRMGMDKYPWADKYGWTSDKYGVEWQLMKAEQKQEIAPALLFVDKLFGKGQEAIDLYTSHFKNSKVEALSKDAETGVIEHGVFTLDGRKFVLMEGPGTHGYSFTEAFSIIVHCKTQEECDRHTNALSNVPEAEQCGWLKDKFGVSWQVVPYELEKLTDGTAKGQNMLKAMLEMKRLDIAKLKQAYEEG